LTSDGRLKGCLMTNAGLVDLRPLLEADAPDAALVEAFETAVRWRRPFFVGPETPVPAADPAETTGLGAALPVLGHP
ncbi:MAG TPA: hypothetical protein VMH78_04185, partial [Thermoplasmata archaeon]|nr:hypothetical protein [Thermoplasmata archaeon]